MSTLPWNHEGQISYLRLGIFVIIVKPGTVGYRAVLGFWGNFDGPKHELLYSTGREDALRNAPVVASQYVHGEACSCAVEGHCGREGHRAEWIANHNGRDMTRERYEQLTSE